MFDYQGLELGRDYYYIDWKLGNICNYKCSYCHQSADKNKFYPYPTKKQLDKAISVIKSFNRNEIEISLAGGETTLYPELKYMLERLDTELKGRLLKVNILTNFHKDVEFFKDLTSNLSPEMPVILFFSLHPEYNEDIDKLRQKIIEVSKFMTVHVAVMYKTGGKIKEIIECIDELFTSGVKIYPKLNLLREGLYANHLMKYTKEELDFCVEMNKKWRTPETCDRGYIWESNEIVRKNLEHNEALIEGDLNFKGMYCAAGSHALWINKSGICSGAVCDIPNKSKFSIYDGINPYLLKDFSRAVRCTIDCCGCKDNLLQPKFKSRNEADIYVSESVCNYK